MSSEQPPPSNPGQSSPTKGLGDWVSANSTTVMAIGAGIVGLLLLLGGVTVGAVAVSSPHGLFDGLGAHMGGSRGGDQEGMARRNERRENPNNNGPHSYNNNNPGQGQGLGAAGILGSIPGIGSVQHGDLVVTGTDGAAKTIRFVRGSVTASTPTSIVVTATDGFVGTFTVSPSTQIGIGANGTAPAVGSNAIVIGTVNGATVTADRIIGVPAASTKPSPAPTR